MGIKIDDMEFHWRWKWNSRSRPSLWGWTRWLTVPEYYSTFCHWKDNMVSQRCPAEESNYIDAFLENLRQELSIKVIHRHSQMSSLAAAYIYAAPEEMRMNIDAMFEESMLNREKVSNEFEASKVFDKIPSRDAQKEFSSVTPPRVFDKFPDQISAKSVSLELAATVDKEFLSMKSYDGDKRLSLLSQIEMDDIEIKSPQIYSSLFDEEKVTMEPTKAIKNSVPEEMENGACKEVLEFKNSLDYDGKAMAKRVLDAQGISENGACNVFDGMLQPVPVSLKSDASLFEDEENDYISSKIKVLQSNEDSLINKAES